MTAPPTFASIEDYTSRLSESAFWAPYVAEILDRHGLADNASQPVPGYNPTHPTFLCGDLVVKLFGYTKAWRVGHAAEGGALALVATDTTITAPQLLAEGRLFASVEAPWPYLVTARVPGTASTHNEFAADELSGVAAQLGRQVRRIHALNPSGIATSADWTPADATTAAKQSSLPSHLVAQIESYLTSLEPTDSVFVHGDLCASHIFVDSGLPTAIIDWGDAMVADRHYEIIQVYRDMFRCDKSLFRVFSRRAIGRLTITFHGRPWGKPCTDRQSD